MALGGVCCFQKSAPAPAMEPHRALGAGQDMGHRGRGVLGHVAARPWLLGAALSLWTPSLCVPFLMSNTKGNMSFKKKKINTTNQN